MQRKSSETSRSSEHSDSNPKVIDGSGSSSIGPDRQSGRNNYSVSERRMNSTTSTSASGKRLYSSSSCESSSEDNDSFQVDAMNFASSSASNHASKHGKNSAFSSASSAKSEVDNNLPIPTPVFQVYNVTHHHNGMPPTVSPPIQVMDRSGGYDPSRIPSSVFERSSFPLEWSVASNESLFSLNLGNNSFSRENAFESGELGTSEESAKSGELNSLGQTPSIIIEEIGYERIEEIDTARESDNVENLQQANETSYEASKSEERLSEDQNDVTDLLQTASCELRLSEDQNDEKDLLQTASCKSRKFIMSSLSHGSATSAQSFAFPVKKRARPLCYCSNCSWAFCCGTWPICNCNCKGSICGWAFCYSWTCSHSKSCCHASPILAESVRKSSVKPDIPREQSYKQDQSYKHDPEEVISKSTSSWCSWCSCRNCCCSCSNWFHFFSCSSCCRWKPCCRWRPCCTCTVTWCNCKCCC